jgi:hypothetical protein
MLECDSSGDDKEGTALACDFPGAHEDGMDPPDRGITTLFEVLVLEPAQT